MGRQNITFNRRNGRPPSELVAVLTQLRKAEKALKGERRGPRIDEVIKYGSSVPNRNVSASFAATMKEAVDEGYAVAHDELGDTVYTLTQKGMELAKPCEPHDSLCCFFLQRNYHGVRVGERIA